MHSEIRIILFYCQLAFSCSLLGISMPCIYRAGYKPPYLSTQHPLPSTTKSHFFWHFLLKKSLLVNKPLVWWFNDTVTPWSQPMQINTVIWIYPPVTRPVWDGNNATMVPIVPVCGTKHAIYEQLYSSFHSQRKSVHNFMICFQKMLLEKVREKGEGCWFYLFFCFVFKARRRNC